jgi:lipoic acid synthetase
VDPSTIELNVLQSAPPPAEQRLRLPEWLRMNPPSAEVRRVFNSTQSSVHENGLHTVCEEARCPNIHDCWSRGTATFMVAGKECTRGCRFCSVETLREPEAPDAEEPGHLAAAVERMGLSHVVITVVNRDDLFDGGAEHYKRCVLAVHKRTPDVTIELLSSDLGGNSAALASLLEDIPLAVFAHNVECAPRLDVEVRDPRASFSQSLDVLRGSKRLRPDIFTKSSIMIGLGETDGEVSDAMRQLRDADVDLLTLGQYIAPGRAGTRFLPVARFVPPPQFDAWADEARKMGFRAVASGPMVRSSFRAGMLLEEARSGVSFA